MKYNFFKFFIFIFIILSLNACENQEQSEEKYISQKSCSNELRYKRNLTEAIKDEMFKTCMKAKGF